MFVMVQLKVKIKLQLKLLHDFVHDFKNLEAHSTLLTKYAGIDTYRQYKLLVNVFFGDIRLEIG